MKWNGIELHVGDKVRLTNKSFINERKNIYLGKVVTIRAFFFEPTLLNRDVFLVEKDYGDIEGGWLFFPEDIVEIVSINDDRVAQVKRISNIINTMEKRNAHYYGKDLTVYEAFADCDNIAEALYDAGCRIYTKEQLELYKEYDIEERRYQRKLAHEKEDAEINKVNRERDYRCMPCQHSRIVWGDDNFKFRGCFCEPYEGKWCIEIETCPKYNKEE